MANPTPFLSRGREGKGRGGNGWEGEGMDGKGGEGRKPGVAVTHTISYVANPTTRVTLNGQILVISMGCFLDVIGVTKKTALPT